MSGKIKAIKKIEAICAKKGEFHKSFIENLNILFFLASNQSFGEQDILIEHFLGWLKKTLRQNDCLEPAEFGNIKKELHSFLTEQLINNKSNIEIFNAYYFLTHQDEFKLNGKKLPQILINDIKSIKSLNDDKDTKALIAHFAGKYFLKINKKADEIIQTMNYRVFRNFALAAIVIYLTIRDYFATSEVDINLNKQEKSSTVYSIRSSLINLLLIPLCIAILRSALISAKTQYLYYLNYKQSENQLFSSIFNFNALIEKVEIEENIKLENRKKSEELDKQKLETREPPETADIKAYSEVPKTNVSKNIDTSNKTSKPSKPQSTITKKNYSAFFKNKEEEDIPPQSIKWISNSSRKSFTLPVDLIEAELSGEQIVPDTKYIVYDSSETINEHVPVFQKIADDAVFYPGDAKRKNGVHCVNKEYEIYVLKFIQKRGADLRVAGTIIADSNNKQQLMYFIGYYSHTDLDQRLTQPRKFRDELRLKAENALNKRLLGPRP